MNRTRFWTLGLALVLLAALSLPACTPKPENPALILATTTSTQDSGLLDVLIPVFEEETGYTVQVVAVGSGEALKMGQEGNADVLLVHAPSSEVTFMENGFGSDRRLVMHNYYMIVGPEADPAGIRGLGPVEAFAAIADSSAQFASRGDDSGTNKMELSLWSKAGIDPAGQSWYVETGQGMGATLTIASETDAYTLTDRATYLANQDTLSLEILVESDASLLNAYHVIVVNPDLWPEINNAGAIAFADFITSDKGQDLIADFGVEEFSQPLFIPDADKTDADLGLP
jgi:tungstate transport system substrate-binding protein